MPVAAPKQVTSLFRVRPADGTSAAAQNGGLRHVPLGSSTANLHQFSGRVQNADVGDWHDSDLPGCPLFDRYRRHNGRGLVSRTDVDEAGRPANRPRYHLLAIY
jgi:hypothetical protein